MGTPSYRNLIDLKNPPPLVVVMFFWLCLKKILAKVSVSKAV